MGAQEPAVGDLSADGTRVWDGRRWEPLALLASDVVEAARARFGQVVGAPRFMAEGLLNESWRVQSDDGAYILRVSRPELSRERVAYEHEVVRRLRDDVREVVAPQPGLDGDTVQRCQGWVLSLFPYVHGRLGAAVEPEVRSPQAAATLARIHAAGVALDIGQADGTYAVDEKPTMWSTVRPVLARDLPRSGEVRELFAFFDRETADVEEWLDGVRRSGRRLRRGVVHSDFNPRNLIFDRDELVAVIDWESCHLDVLAFEVAGRALGAPDPLTFWRTYLDAGGPLAADDVELLGGFARIDRLLELYFTVEDGRAKSWAVENLRGVATEVSDLRERIAALGL